MMLYTVVVRISSTRLSLHNYMFGVNMLNVGNFVGNKCVTNKCSSQHSLRRILTKFL